MQVESDCNTLPTGSTLKGKPLLCIVRRYGIQLAKLRA